MKFPLVPQQYAAKIISLHPFYVKHKGGKTYEKRVSWIEDSSFKSVAVYEYKGHSPNQNPHERAHAGNNPGPYIRQKPETLNKVKDQLVKAKEEATRKKPCAQPWQERFMIQLDGPAQCTRHIRNNLKAYLDDQGGLDKTNGMFQLFGN
ncbi:hypothetical protein RRG08_026914 [Elysia crispata]|uniref:Uncharacterized protein n=1 Tax=Elysia crispata TaxID=231223 RepID=A0AAE1DHX4_9GAST|nr:hypothetical protein RRG08_026914 [Elysia crispata]